MGKRGPKPKVLVNTEWSANLAYAIGLLATDGCLAKHQTLVDLTSKDQEQLKNFNKCIGLDLKIGDKKSSSGSKSFRVQLKNRVFYDFLLAVGLTPSKSKTIGKVKIPEEYFFDFLRGCFDGDGCFYSYWDTRWKSSFMFYTVFVSASKDFIDWIREYNRRTLSINGHISMDGRKSTYELKYAKRESLILLEKMYDLPNVVCLSRKRLKIKKALDTIGMPVQYIT